MAILKTSTLTKGFKTALKGNTEDISNVFHTWWSSLLDTCRWCRKLLPEPPAENHRWTAPKPLRSSATNKQTRICFFVKVSIHIPSLKILISHLLPGTPIQHLAQISTWPPFLCSEWGPVALGSFSYSGWLWWSQTHRRKSSRNKSVKIKCRSHHSLHTHTWLQVLFLCFDFFTISLLVVLWKESVCLKPVNTAYMTCFCLRRLSVWRGNPHYSSFYPVVSELTEGVICGGLGGDAVSGGTGCEGADDEPGASELTGLLGSKRKQTFVTQDEKYNKTKQRKAVTRWPEFSCHLPIIMGKKGTSLVLRCSSAVMAASRDKHMAWPSSDSSTYLRHSGLRPLSPASPFTVYDFPLLSTTRTSSDVLWVFAPARCSFYTLI